MTNMKRHSENTIELSTDINVITAEINAYQRVAGEAIFEIGRRLKHVRGSKLTEGHGGWTAWLREVGISTSQADRFIKVVTELEGKFPTSGSIGLGTLYEIATLPPTEREVEHVTAKGETKTPDEMTVKELRELKRQLKEEQERAEELEKKNKELQKEKEEEYKEHVDHDYDRSDKDTYGLQLLNEFYKAADEASEWQKKFAWITHDVENLRDYARMDSDLINEYQKMRGMFEKLDEVFYGKSDERTIIEVIEN